MQTNITIIAYLNGIVNQNYKIVNKNLLVTTFVCAIMLVAISCGKDKTPAPTPTPTNPCTGVTISLTTTKVDATGSAANGSITVTSPTGSGFTYSINNGAFVSSTQFANLSPGNYTLTAKNGNGCTGTLSVTITTDACAGKTIAITAPNISTATPCNATNNGAISASASGSTGFTYSINGTTFQSTGLFNNLAAGTYTISARDVDGCVKTQSFTVGVTPAGPLFTAVRGVVQANCVSCHGASGASGGFVLATDCDIVNKWSQINNRAVLGTPSWMPQSGPMPISERNKITNWINAGRRYID